MPRCDPPKSVFVRAYERVVGRRRRKRQAPAGAYWTCADNTGRTCGTRHKSPAAALRHTKRLNREERARSARFSTAKKRVKAKRWEVEHRKG